MLIGLRIGSMMVFRSGLCGQLVRSNQFSNLFLLDHRQQGFVADNFSTMAGGVVWNLSFCRNLTDNEIVEFAVLMGIAQ